MDILKDMLKDDNLFLDRYPIDMGHCLLVPKKHYERITDMSSADVGSIFSKVPKLASIILQETGASAFSLGQNNGREAKQIIGHVHVHIIPRIVGLFGQRGVFQTWKIWIN